MALVVNGNECTHIFAAPRPLLGNEWEQNAHTSLAGIAFPWLLMPFWRKHEAVPPDVCPNCGAEVPARARVCPECGADEETGWSEEASVGGLGLPDDSFDYNEFTKREFDLEKTSIRGVGRIWQVIAVLLVVLLLGFLWHRWF